jgi:hypothetical protein
MILMNIYIIEKNKEKLTRSTNGCQSSNYLYSFFLYSFDLLSFIHRDHMTFFFYMLTGYHRKKNSHMIFMNILWTR